MGHQHKLRALPLLLRRRDLRGLKFPLTEVWHRVDDYPWYASSKVHELMEDETHHTSRERRVAKPEVPCSPFLLEKVELIEVGTRVKQLGGVVQRRRRVHRHLEGWWSEEKRQELGFFSFHR